MIDTKYARSAVNHLKRQGIRFDWGLSNKEFSAIEQKFGFNFPPDLRLLLQVALPVSEDFPNWRLYKNVPSEAEVDWEAKGRTLAQSIYWPFEGIRFDIEANNFWLEGEWGKRPELLEDAIRIANQHFLQYPTLIPIYSHRYIPDEPLLGGNPVFSVYQTDIIYYGIDLPAYLEHEFGVPNPYSYPVIEPQTIKFWTELCNANK